MKKIVLMIIGIFLIFIFSTQRILADESDESTEDKTAYTISLERIHTMKDYLNEVYLNKYPNLAFDIDYCSPEDINFLSNVANYITNGCYSNLDKAESIFNWMTNNISYGLTTNSFSAIDVYKNKEGVCSGQAQLMSTLFRLSGIPSALVGCSRTYPQAMSRRQADTDLYKNPHIFVVAYVDNDWYGYDSTTKSNHKLNDEYMAARYLVIHVDGVMTYSEAWSTYNSSSTETWYKDGEFLSMRNGEVVESGGSGLQTGGCLNYYRQHYNRGTSSYYIYQGEENTNEIGHALQGGYYTTQYINTKDVICVQENGLLEIEYFYFNGQRYYDGIPIDSEFTDIGFTNINGNLYVSINMYIGETVDLSDTFTGLTISVSNSNISVDGSIITAVSAGECELTAKGNGKNYTLHLYVTNYIGDNLTQQLCNHNYIYNDKCMYCGKEIISEVTELSFSSPEPEEIEEVPEVVQITSENEITENYVIEEVIEVISNPIKHELSFKEMINKFITHKSINLLKHLKVRGNI